MLPLGDCLNNADFKAPKPSFFLQTLLLQTLSTCHSSWLPQSQVFMLLDWWDCPDPEQGQTSHPASSAFLLLDLQLNSGEKFSDTIPSFSGGYPLQALWHHDITEANTHCWRRPQWETLLSCHQGQKILRNTPNVQKSYRHFFTRKRNSVEACQSCNHERLNLHGRQRSGLNFFRVTGTSPHHHTAAGVGCADGNDGNDQVKPWQTELRKCHF